MWCALRRGGVMAAFLAFLAVAWAPPGGAANAVDAKLDAAAATISGDSGLRTYCENDQKEWDRWSALVSVPSSESLLGFTSLVNPDPLTGGHFVYISPRPCSVLTAFVESRPAEFAASFQYEDAGAAVLVLTHEAMHQRLRSGDEALVECNAMKYLPWVIQTVFQTPATVLVKIAVRARVKRHGKWVRVLRSKVVRRANPIYSAMNTGAVLLDAGTPAQYHGGTC
jgi:hypothetical protein